MLSQYDNQYPLTLKIRPKQYLLETLIEYDNRVLHKIILHENSYVLLIHLELLYQFQKYNLLGETLSNSNSLL
ncbi:hypothetical protein ES705_32438 [subsurface metagenome]